MIKIKSLTVNMKAENTYVVSDRTGECIIIDCGCKTPEEEEALREYVRSEGLKVRRLTCTHFHLDHTFGNAFVEREYGVVAEASEADHLLAEMIDYQLIAFGIEEVGIVIPIPSYTMVDGAKVKFGETEFEVIATPGHSPGGVSFYCHAEGVLFSGDTLMKGAVGATNLPGGRKTKLVKSIQRLFELPDETVVYSGHGAPTTIGEEKRSNPIASEIKEKQEDKPNAQ